MVLCTQLLLPTEPGGAPPSQDCSALPSSTPWTHFGAPEPPASGPTRPTRPHEASPGCVGVTVPPRTGTHSHTPWQQRGQTALGHKSVRPAPFPAPQPQGLPKVFHTRHLPLPSHCGSSLIERGARHSAPGAPQAGNHGPMESLRAWRSSRGSHGQPSAPARLWEQRQLSSLLPALPSMSFSPFPGAQVMLAPGSAPELLPNLITGLDEEGIAPLPCR